MGEAPDRMGKTPVELRARRGGRRRVRIELVLPLMLHQPASNGIVYWTFVFSNSFSRRMYVIVVVSRQKHKSSYARTIMYAKADANFQ